MRVGPKEKPNTPAERELANKFGVGIQTVRRYGIERLQRMTEDAQRLVLCPPKLSISALELHRGGLRVRGMKVRGNPYTDIPERRRA